MTRIFTSSDHELIDRAAVHAEEVVIIGVIQLALEDLFVKCKTCQEWWFKKDLTEGYCGLCHRSRN